MTERIQACLRDYKLEGWLFFDHHRRDALAYRILGLPDYLEATRRWYYFIPAEGEPVKLVHKIESRALDTLPGRKIEYASWPEQISGVAQALGNAKKVAMQYSPRCAIPYISLVDAGTIELVRAVGAEPVTSGDLVQEFEARLSADQFASHLRAGKFVDRVRREAFDLVGARLRSKEAVTEFDVQQFIRRGFESHNLICDHGPIVAVNANASDPHYEPQREKHSAIARGDLLLIDLWAKIDEKASVYYDITWVGYCDEIVPELMQKVFGIVRQARQAAFQRVNDALGARRSLCGWHVDDAAREVIGEAGYGDYFFHRTGHSIGTEVHGNGANLDNLESHDERRILPDTLFSIEPGIYLPEFGVRSEVNVFVHQNRAEVTGEEQDQIIRV